MSAPNKKTDLKTKQKHSLIFLPFQDSNLLILNIVSLQIIVLKWNIEIWAMSLPPYFKHNFYLRMSTAFTLDGWTSFPQRRKYHGNIKYTSNTQLCAYPSQEICYVLQRGWYLPIYRTWYSQLATHLVPTGTTLLTLMRTSVST